jgi:DNA polymerase I-like protein with 3'-5' exonuclease and polymerase domains
MVTIWAGKTPYRKVLTQLSPVLAHNQDIPLKIVNDFSVPTSTKVVLALGSEPLKALQEEKLVPKNRTITSLRTSPIAQNGHQILVSYDAGIGEIDNRYYIDLLTDVALAMRFCRTGSFQPKMGKYQWVDDLSEVCAYIQQRADQTKEPVDVMLDLETLGLDPYRLPTANHPGAYIVSIQVCAQIGTGYAVRFHSRQDEADRLAPDTKLWQQLCWLLTNPQIKMRGANFKYDLHWLYVRAGVECSNFTFDTNLVGTLLDENRSNGLDLHVKMYAPRLAGYSDEFDRVVDKSRMDLALTNAPAKFLDYACGDVDGGLEASQVMKKVLCEDKHLTALYCNILHPASRAFEKIERGGVFVDREALRELKADLEAEQVALVKRARQILGGRIVAKHHDPTKIGGINLTKANLIRDYMFSRTMGLGLRHRMATDSTEELPHDQQDPATSAEHLKMFADDPKARDFISVHQEYSQVTKTYNTYVVGFLEHLRSDGKFHPTYYLFMGNRDEDEGGTVTGRLSCKDPAFQTIPKRTKWAKRIRRCYPAPPGYVVVERDYSQGELRVIACIAHCKKMLEVYQQGKDLHTKTAASAAKMSYDVLEAMKKTDEDQYEAIRQKGKAGNFGLCFRMGAEGFREYARKNYDVIFTLPEAEEFRNAFFAEYPELLRYHDNCVEQVHKYQHVRTPLGRIRHLPLIKSPDRKKRSEAERHAINSPVQGCLTDMLMWDFALEDAAGMFEVAPAFGAVHDAAYNYCPEDRVDIEIPRMLDIQENLPFERLGWKPQLPFLADAKYGPNMADLKKFSRKG